MTIYATGIATPLAARAALAIGPAIVVTLTVIGGVLRLTHDTSSLPIAVGDALGCAGMAAFALTLILAGRFRSIESLFVGLDRVYRVHHRLAVCALALLCSHPIALAIAVPDVNGARRAFLAAWPETDMLSGWIALVVLIAGMIASVMTMPHRWWWMIHVGLGGSFVIGAWHLIAVAHWPPTPEVVFLVILGAAGIATMLRRLMRTGVPRYAYEVVSVSPIDGRTVEVELAPRGARLQQQAGQFVFASFRCHGACGVSRESHPFTLASSPRHGNVRLLITAAGDDTCCLQRLERGTTVVLEGPYGRFARPRRPGAPRIWIAGGVGIAPFRAMAEASDDAETIVVHAVAHDSTAREFEDSRAAVAADGRRTVLVHIDDRDGLLDGKQLRRLCPDIDRREVWLCGPPTMVTALKKSLHRLGVPRWLIHAEEFT